MNADDLAGTDDLSRYTPLHRENYVRETAHIIESLQQGASVLQIGSMDGVRVIGVLRTRPDLVFTGLDIEQGLTDIAKANVEAAGVRATFVTGDILSPHRLQHFDHVLCLNNTLSYISHPSKAISNMRALGKRVMVSLFTEAFDEREATAYYDTLGLSVERVCDDAFVMSDGWRVHRFTDAAVASLNGVKARTPLGWLVRLPA